jgi:hypothetical protein
MSKLQSKVQSLITVGHNKPRNWVSQITIHPNVQSQQLLFTNDTLKLLPDFAILTYKLLYSLISATLTLERSISTTPIH